MDKTAVRQHFDETAAKRDEYYQRNRIYHQQIIEACLPFVNPDSRILELGCATGNTLGALGGAVRVGVDFSPRMIDIARQNYPDDTWICADIEALPAHPALAQPFDLIVIEDVTGYLDDIQAFLEHLKRLTHPGTRLVLSTWNWMWEPVLRAAEALKLKSADVSIRENWVSAYVLRHFLALAGYEVLAQQPGILFPYQIPLVSGFINSLSYAPILEQLTLLSIVIARPAERLIAQDYTVSVIIPTRNEAGNIAALVERTPQMGAHTELIFVDGSSTDGTVEAIHQHIAAHPERDIRFIPQVPPHDPNSDAPPNLMLKLGKGDAVRKGFAAATGDILMILDSDISVRPEDLTKFYNVLASGQADFANGTRFVYEQQSGAMKPLNRLGNLFFSLAFRWLLSQPISDTLCGTKVLFRHHYEDIARNRATFGDFDPFGDFDLLFGAAWLGHRIVDVPVRYLARVYGESKVRVNTHGPLLGRMSLIALWYFKLRPLLGMGRARPKPHAVQPARPRPSYIAWLGAAAVMLLLIAARLLNRRQRP